MDTADLVRAAQDGDAGALGALIAHHRPAMMAVALSLLSQPADAEDAVQDAALTALVRIGDLRDPAAAGPWLKMIVRNRCRTALRSPAPTPVDELRAVAGLGNPDDLLERHALRDWVAQAVADLPPSLRTVTMLRYFTAVSSTHDMAALCGIPAGTVRRRLHEARRALSAKLAAARSRPFDGAGDWRRSRAAAEAAAEAGIGGTFGAYLRDGWDPHVRSAWAGGRREHGFAPLIRIMDSNVAAGMLPRVRDVSASRDLALWQIDVVQTGPERVCAADAYWLLSMHDGRVSELRIFQRG
ncbi:MULTISPECIES: RNA polymerase sigma factor [Catenuloplanes]|uniref:RNA polymerase sigma-70 factor (ECF subfamily) n=1 Tax=Catenuloplanes niger TaxID=587534 RepID=A0AAE3ZZI1_9ACTN|nr:sigma-70 family RNA polymerase sigma factor [Catenuloplanes niger]MDR7327681.1 RNA polymerase sigma-70 factor (ECF subfamily) [Catenuloplanes niger]